MFGVGLYSISGVYGKKDLKSIEKMLLRAIEEGVDYFDVAPVYGEAEEFLGEIIKPYRNKVKIATKGGVSRQGEIDSSYKVLKKSCKESLLRLQTDYIDHYQVHFSDPKTPVENSIQALEELKQEGLINSYGLGHFTRKRIAEFSNQGNPTSVLLEISPLNTMDYLTIRDLCQEKGLGLIAMGVTGRGFLSGKITERTKFSSGDIRNRDPFFHPALSAWRVSVFEFLDFLGGKYGKTPIQVAINWVSSLPEIKRILVGPSSWEHLEENLGGVGWQMDDSDKKELNEFILEKGLEKNKISREKAHDFLKQEKTSFREIIFVIEALFSQNIIGEEDAHAFFKELLKVSEDEKQLKSLQQRILEAYINKIS